MASFCRSLLFLQNGQMRNPNYDSRQFLPNRDVVFGAGTVISRFVAPALVVVIRNLIFRVDVCDQVSLAITKWSET